MAVHDLDCQLGERSPLVDLDESDFERIGAAFVAGGQVRSGIVGEATAQLFAVTASVAFAAAWLRVHRAQAQG